MSMLGCRYCTILDRKMKKYTIYPPHITLCWVLTCWVLSVIKFQSTTLVLRSLPVCALYVALRTTIWPWITSMLGWGIWIWAHMPRRRRREESGESSVWPMSSSKLTVKLNELCVLYQTVISLCIPIPIHLLFSIKLDMSYHAMSRAHMCGIQYCSWQWQERKKKVLIYKNIQAQTAAQNTTIQQQNHQVHKFKGKYINKRKEGGI